MGHLFWNGGSTKMGHLFWNGGTTIVGYKPALHGIFAYVEERGNKKVEQWALMQEPASTWWSIGRGTCMEVVRNWETRAGHSAAVKMIMASQIMGPHLSSSNSRSNHTALRLQQPTASSSRVSIEPTRRNCPAYRAGKAPPSNFKYNYIRLRIQ